MVKQFKKNRVALMASERHREMIRLKAKQNRRKIKEETEIMIENHCVEESK